MSHDEAEKPIETQWTELREMLVQWAMPQGSDALRVGDKLFDAFLMRGKRIDELAVRHNDAVVERSAALNERDRTREQFADLKKRLHDSEIEIARLGGYLERVGEDDQVRDGVEMIKEEDGTHLRQVRPPMRQRVASDDGRPMAPVYDSYGRQVGKTRVHWVNYGG